MNKDKWNALCSFKENFKSKIDELYAELKSEGLLNELVELQKAAAAKDGTPEYPIENSLVYNTALDEITESDEIKLLVIGDNPGKDEQLNKNRKYLVGQAGKIAEGFFKKNGELNIDFRKNVIILNKTPFHTAKTKELQFISRQNEKIGTIIKESQVWMANHTALLHKALNENKGECGFWLVGYSELKEKGFFSDYKKELTKFYENDENKDSLFVFQHFSMNRFSIDLKESSLKYESRKSLSELIGLVGKTHRIEILGF